MVSFLLKYSESAVAGGSSSKEDCAYTVPLGITGYKESGISEYKILNFSSPKISNALVYSKSRSYPASVLVICLINNADFKLLHCSGSYPRSLYSIGNSLVFNFSINELMPAV